MYFDFEEPVRVLQGLGALHGQPGLVLPPLPGAEHLGYLGTSLHEDHVLGTYMPNTRSLLAGALRLKLEGGSEVSVVQLSLRRSSWPV